MAPNTKYAENIQIGDVLSVLGNSHTITRIEPYTPGKHANRAELGDITGWRIAHSGDDWAITLVPGGALNLA